jgi:hypothetical protein
MARALLGHLGTQADQSLAFELMRLRQRVAALEAELADLRAAQTEAGLELELHRLAGDSQPALA